MSFNFPSVNFDRAIHENDVDEVERLAPIVGEFYTYEGMEKAINRGKIDIVRVLLPYIDPLKDSSLMLQYASLWGKQDIFDALYEVSDPEAALASIELKIQVGQFSGGHEMIEQRLKSQHEHNILSDTVGTAVVRSVKKI